jgi:FCP1-like phosphatase family protein
MESDWELWAVRAPGADLVEASTRSNTFQHEAETTEPRTCSTTSSASLAVATTLRRDSATPPSSSVTPLDESAAANVSVEAQNDSALLPDLEGRRESIVSRNAGKYSPFYVVLRWYVQNDASVEAGGLLAGLVRFSLSWRSASAGVEGLPDVAAELHSTDSTLARRGSGGTAWMPNGSHCPMIRAGHIEVRSQVSGIVQHLVEPPPADLLELLEKIIQSETEKGLLFEHMSIFAHSSSRIEPGQVIGAVRYCPHTTVYRGICVNCQKDVSAADCVRISPSEALRYGDHGYKFGSHRIGGNQVEIADAERDPMSTIHRIGRRTHVPLAYQDQQLTVSIRRAEELAEENTKRLLRGRKLSLVLDLDHTLLHATNDPRAQQILLALVNKLRLALGNARTRREWEQALLDQDTCPLELLLEKLSDTRESSGMEMKMSSKEKEAPLADEAAPPSEELLEALFQRLGIFAFTIGSSFVSSRSSFSGIFSPARISGDMNPEQRAPSVTRASNTVASSSAADTSASVYYIKLRPGLREFLQQVASRFELHIYTMGSRPYADAIAAVIDSDKRLFQGRITSRDDFEEGRLNQKNLKHVFPCDDSMVLVVDDREDVWVAQDVLPRTGHFPNLIKARPYYFFRGLEEAYQRDPHTSTPLLVSEDQADRTTGVSMTTDLPSETELRPVKGTLPGDLDLGFRSALLFLQQWLTADRQDRDHLKRLAEILAECHEYFFALYDKLVAAECFEDVLTMNERDSGISGSKSQFSRAFPENSDLLQRRRLENPISHEKWKQGALSESLQSAGQVASRRPYSRCDEPSSTEHNDRRDMSDDAGTKPDSEPVHAVKAKQLSENIRTVTDPRARVDGGIDGNRESALPSAADTAPQDDTMRRAPHAQLRHASGITSEKGLRSEGEGGSCLPTPVCAPRILSRDSEPKYAYGDRSISLSRPELCDERLPLQQKARAHYWKSDQGKSESTQGHAFASYVGDTVDFVHASCDNELSLGGKRFVRAADATAAQAADDGFWLDGNCPSSILGTDGGGEFADGNQASSVAAEARSLRVVDSDAADDENAEDDEDDESVAVASPSPAPTVHQFTSVMDVQDDELEIDLTKGQEVVSSQQSQAEPLRGAGSLALSDSWGSDNPVAKPLGLPDSMKIPGRDFEKVGTQAEDFGLRRSRRIAQRCQRLSNEDSGDFSTDSRSTTRATLGSTMAVMRSEKKRDAITIEDDASVRDTRRCSHRKQSVATTEPFEEVKTKRRYTTVPKSGVTDTYLLPSKRVRNHIFEKTKEQRRSPSPATQLRENLLHRTAALALAEKRPEIVSALTKAPEDMSRMLPSAVPSEDVGAVRRPRRLLRRYRQHAQTSVADGIAPTPGWAKVSDSGADAGLETSSLKGAIWRPPASIKEILVALRSSVLAGCELCFTGLFPIQMNAQLEDHELWRLAVRFGAICHRDLVPQVTHLIADPLRGRDTQKAELARAMGGIFVVRPEWLLCSAEEMRRANELEFLLESAARDAKTSGLHVATDQTEIRYDSGTKTGEPPSRDIFGDDRLETFRLSMAKVRAERLGQTFPTCSVEHQVSGKDEKGASPVILDSVSSAKKEGRLSETVNHASDKYKGELGADTTPSSVRADESTEFDPLLERELEVCLDGTAPDERE